MNSQSTSVETSCPFNWVVPNESNTCIDDTSCDAIKCSTSGMLLPGTIADEPVVKKPYVSTVDVGVQTGTTAIPRKPVEGRSFIVSWGLDTRAPSPLTINHTNNNKKRKREESDSSLPPKKRPAHEDQEHALGDVPKTPIYNDEYQEDYNDINEEELSGSIITCPYEGVVEVSISNNGSRSISTNTIHVPKRRGPVKYYRYDDWCHTALLHLSREDRLDKSLSLGPERYRTKRMKKVISSYRKRHTS